MGYSEKSFMTDFIKQEYIAFWKMNDEDKLGCV